MPLDKFQKDVLAVISRNRDADSPCAGGGVIQCHGIRLTDDQDIFAAGDGQLDGLVEADRRALEGAGFTIELRRGYDGFRECIVTKPLKGKTVLQWTAGLNREFFAPVPDAQFGFRLHYADLAVNKALAAAGRSRLRDFVDLVMLDRFVMPLWRMACAAPGKDTRINPFSLIEQMSRNWSMAGRRESMDELTLTTELSIGEVGVAVNLAFRETLTRLNDVPAEYFGRLEIYAGGEAVTGPDSVPGSTWMLPRMGGALPSFTGIDDEMTAGLIAEFGPEGSRFTGAAPVPSGRNCR